MEDKRDWQLHSCICAYCLNAALDPGCSLTYVYVGIICKCGIEEQLALVKC